MESARERETERGREGGRESGPASRSHVLGSSGESRIEGEENANGGSTPKSPVMTRFVITETHKSQTTSVCAPLWILMLQAKCLLDFAPSINPSMLSERMPVELTRSRQGNVLLVRMRLRWQVIDRAIPIKHLRGPE